MKTNKDLIFGISLLTWLSSNILCSLFFGPFGVAVSNFVCIILFATMTLVKFKNRRFGNWLEKSRKI